MKNIRIVFCGNAGSGKTSIWRYLQKNLDPAIGDWNTVFAEEAATAILDRSDLHPKIDSLKFQLAVALYQICEESDKRLDPSRNNLILCDRGLCDINIYLDEGSARLVTETVMKTTFGCLLERYDTVFLFDSYRPDNISSGNACRYETADELRELDLRTQAVWSRHPNVIKVPCFETIEEKAVFVASKLNGILGIKLFGEEK